MNHYVSIIRSKEVPEEYGSTDVFEGSDALNYFTYAICGNNTELTIDILMESLVSMIVNRTEVEDHRPDIRHYVGVFADRLGDAFEAHDDLFSDSDDITADDCEEDSEDIDGDEPDLQIAAYPELPEEPQDPPCRRSPYQRGIATALKVKVEGREPFLVPVDCIDDIICQEHKRSGFCLCRIRSLGYPIPEDASLVEYIKAVKVPTKVLTHHYDGFRVFITDLPERIPDDG